jgi:hypothetical protein
LWATPSGRIRHALQIENGELNGSRDLFLDETRDLAFQTTAILQDPVNVEPRLADCAAPAIAGVDSRGVFELNQVMNDPRNLAS